MLTEEDCCVFCVGILSEPVRLECGHWACMECAVRGAGHIAAAIESDKAKGAQVFVCCPVCGRHTAKVEKDAEKERHVRSAVEDVKRWYLMCTAKDCEKDADWVCEACGPLCDEHNKAIHALMSHRVERFDTVKFDAFFEKMPEDDMWRCLKCRKNFQSKDLRKHWNHNCKPWDEMHERHMADVKKCAARARNVKAVLLKENEKEFEHVAERLRDDTKKFYEKLRAQIAANEKRDMEMLERMLAEESVAFDERKEHVSTLIEELEVFEDAVQRAETLDKFVVTKRLRAQMQQRIEEIEQMGTALTAERIRLALPNLSALQAQIVQKRDPNPTRILPKYAQPSGSVDDAYSEDELPKRP